MRAVAPSDEEDHARNSDDRGPNTYYGQWLKQKTRFAGVELPAIAHGELVANGKIRDL